MTTADHVSIIVAALAVLIALFALYVMWRTRGQHDAAEETEPVVATVEGPVSVRLIRGSDGGQVWRFEVTDDAPPTRLDVFTFRRRSDGFRDWWHHELMDGPRELLPRRPVELEAPPPIDGAVYEAAVGWTSNGTSGKAESAFVLVPSPR